MAREHDVPTSKIYAVMSYLHRDEIRRLAEQDEGRGIHATKCKRAAATLYLAKKDEDAKKVLDMVKDWDKGGPPPEIQRQ